MIRSHQSISDSFISRGCRFMSQMDEGLKGAECADSAARLPLPAIVPTANASTEIITPVHIFCLQNQIRDMGHNLGVSCQDYMLPDTLLQILQLSDMKAMLENSIATLQRMLHSTDRKSGQT